MKQRLQRYSFVFFSAFVVNIVSLSHVSAMPAGAHHMGGVTGMTNCATVCLSTPVNKQNHDDIQIKDNDDQPDEPYYVRFTTIDIYSYTNMYGPDSPDLSDDPVYKRCCVIRR